MKNTDDFRFEGNPSHVIAKLTPFPVSKDEWDTKKDTGKSMKNALHVCSMPKGTCRAKATGNLKFRSNLLKVFRVDLKACLGLVLPHQYCLIVARDN